MPWVPPALYEVMVAAVRDAQAVKPSPVMPDDVVAVPRDVFAAMIAALAPEPAEPAQPVVKAAPPAEPAVEIPEGVTHAIAHYAFGDPVEAAANYQRAVALIKAGRKPSEIITEIRQGANPEAFI